MSIDWANETVITAQRILLTCGVVAMICAIGLMLTPRDER